MIQGDTYKCTIDRPTILQYFYISLPFYKMNEFSIHQPINQITILIKNIKKQHNITNPT